MLYAVPPPGAKGQDPPKRKGVRAPCFQLTDAEANALYASIRNIARTRYGTIVKLAAALGCSAHMLSKRKRHGAALALALARVANVSVDSVLGRVALAALPGGAS